MASDVWVRGALPLIGANRAKAFGLMRFQQHRIVAVAVARPPLGGLLVGVEVLMHELLDGFRCGGVDFGVARE